LLARPGSVGSYFFARRSREGGNPVSLALED
jgi:hypothetical protein